MRGYVKIVGVLAVALILVSVAMLNADQQVTLTLLPGVALPQLPVFVIILLAMLGGVIVAAVVSIPAQLRRGLQLRELRRTIARLEAEQGASPAAPPAKPPRLAVEPIEPLPPPRAEAEPRGGASASAPDPDAEPTTAESAGPGLRPD